MICEFSEVKQLGVSPPDFEYSRLTCEDPTSTIELIENATTGGEFYLEKSFSYGDLILTIFLSIFLIFGVFKILWNFTFGGFGKKL